MISLDSHEPYLLNLEVMLLKNFPSFYKTKIAAIFVQFEVIMVGDDYFTACTESKVINYP